MSAIKYGVDRIFREINEHILKLAFLRKSEFFSVNTTLASQIEDLVIRNIVLKDTNLLGGITVRLPLNQCQLNYYEQNLTNHNLVIKVPYKLTNNKKIIEATTLMVTTNYDTSYNTSKNTITNQLSRIVEHNSGPTENLTTSNLEIIAPNTILVHDTIYMTSNGFLEVIVENNNNLSNISPRTYFLFGKICVLAAKMFIYNKLVVDLDAGVLYNGHELGKASEIINSYESAFEDYETLINEEWGKALFMNDSVAKADFLKGMIGSNI